jgi:hypothetical protein
MLLTKRKIVKGFCGCYFHGFPKCHPELQENITKRNSAKIYLEVKVTVWQLYENATGWKKSSNRGEIEVQAKKQSARIRGALHGGRCETFKRYVKCTHKQKLFPKSR